MRFSPVRGANLMQDTFCKSRSCRQILSRLRADLRENPTKQWASRDAPIQSARSISNSARYHSDTNIALGPILKMYIPGQIRIFNVLNSDGYSTGNAPPSGNNDWCLMGPSHYLNQCWDLSSMGIHWHSHKTNFIGSAQNMNLQYEIEKYTFEITFTSHRVQLVKAWALFQYEDRLSQVWEFPY